MKILFIEDEERKEKQVKEFIQSLNKNHIIFIEHSLMSGIKRIQNKEFDLVLLDMSLPLYDTESSLNEDNEFEPFAGLEIIEEMKRINYKVKTVIITAFDLIEDDIRTLTLEQINSKLKEDYPEIHMESIFYNSSSLEWKKNLKEIIEKLGDV